MAEEEINSSDLYINQEAIERIEREDILRNILLEIETHVRVRHPGEFQGINVTNEQNHVGEHQLRILCQCGQEWYIGPETLQILGPERTEEEINELMEVLNRQINPATVNENTGVLLGQQNIPTDRAAVIRPIPINRPIRRAGLPIEQAQQAIEVRVDEDPNNPVPDPIPEEEPPPPPPPENENKNNPIASLDF